MPPPDPAAPALPAAPAVPAAGAVPPSTPAPVFQQPVLPPPVPARPREYPQALRGPRHRWWRPVLGLATLLAGVGAAAGLILVATLGLVVAQVVGLDLGDPATDEFLVSPAGMLLTNLALALGIPAAILATLVQAGRPGLVTSVVGRVRRRLLFGGLGLSLVLLLPLTLAGSLLVSALGLGSEPAGGDDALWPLTPAASWLALAVVVLLTTPLQAAGEEYFFRGWATQWLGSMLRWRWVALVLPAVVTAVLFAMAHGSQSPWLFADRLVFGLVASLLVWRAGGLELAVAMHAANNLVAFGFAIAYDGLADSLLVTEVTPAEGAVSIAGTVVTAAVLLWWARRQRPAVLVPGDVRRDARPDVRAEEVAA